MLLFDKGLWNCRVLMSVGLCLRPRIIMHCYEGIYANPFGPSTNSWQSRDPWRVLLFPVEWPILLLNRFQSPANRKLFHSYLPLHLTSLLGNTTWKHSTSGLAKSYDPIWTLHWYLGIEHEKSNQEKNRSQARRNTRVFYTSAWGKRDHCQVETRLIVTATLSGHLEYENPAKYYRFGTIILQDWV